MNRHLLALVLISLSVIGASGCATRLRYVRPNQRSQTQYVIKSGDTLWLIAKKTGVPMRQLMANNQIDDPHHISVGQVIYIPQPDPFFILEEQKFTPLSKDVPAGPSSSITFVWPVDGVVFQEFSEKAPRIYEGIAIGAPALSGVHAAQSGEIVFADHSGQYGNMIMIRHDGNFITLYGNLDTVTVKKGDRVAQGDIIGTVGTSGDVESPRVHFQIRKNRVAVDPLKYLPKT